MFLFLGRKNGKSAKTVSEYAEHKSTDDFIASDTSLPPTKTEYKNSIGENEIVISDGVVGFPQDYNGYYWVNATTYQDRANGFWRYIRAYKIIQWEDLVKELKGDN